MGATLQTGSAITFILVGMVGAGTITVDRSLPVGLGAAVGTSTMVFVATLDIQTLILFLIGISGIALSQSHSPRPILGILFGGGLMFFGLRMVGASAASLTDLAGQKVGIKQVSNSIWLVSFMQYDLGYFDLDACRLEPIDNPFSAKVLPMSPV